MSLTMLRGAMIGALLVTAFTHAAHAQSLVRGTILDERKQPLEGVLIAFDATEFANQREARTDKRGQFQFQGLDSGASRIIVSKSGYETITMTRAVSRTNRLDVNLTLNSLVSLRRASKSPAGPPSLNPQSIASEAVPTEAAGDTAAAENPLAALATDTSPATKASGISATHYNEGVVLWNAGKYAEARVQFEVATKADPQNAPAFYRLGVAHLNQGQLQEARAAFGAYLSVAPDGPFAGEAKTMLQQLPTESNQKR